MKEILLDPGLLALAGVIFTGLIGHLHSRRSKIDKFHKSKLSTDQKVKVLLRWYQENYHKARMLMIQNNMGEVVDKHLPFEPPLNLMQETTTDNEE